MTRSIIFTLIGVIGGIGSIVGVAISLYVIFSSGEEPSIELHTTSSLALVAQSGPFSERLQVTFDEDKVENELWVTRFTVINNGKTDVGPSDFSGPLEFSTNSGQIFDVVPEEPRLPGLDIRMAASNENTFFLYPLLLKRGESISFSVLSNEKLNQLSLPPRINIKNVDQVRVKPLLNERGNGSSLLTPFILFTLSSLYFFAGGLYWIWGFRYWRRIRRERTNT